MTDIFLTVKEYVKCIYRQERLEFGYKWIEETTIKYTCCLAHSLCGYGGRKRKNDEIAKFLGLKQPSQVKEKMDAVVNNSAINEMAYIKEIEEELENLRAEREDMIIGCVRLSNKARRQKLIEEEFEKDIYFNALKQLPTKISRDQPKQ